MIETPENPDIKELAQQVRELKSQLVLLAAQVKTNGRLARRQNVRQDKELAYLKNIMFCSVLSFGVWMFAGNRIADSEISDENLSKIIELVGLGLTGGVGVTAISRAQKHMEETEEFDADEQG